MDAKDKAAIAMLDDLRKSWQVEFYTHLDTGDAVVELFPKRAIGRPDVTDMVARYVESDIRIAIARAWAGEAADG